MIAKDVRPRFEVEPLEGEVEETYYERDDDLKMNVAKTRSVPRGWMVYFANGNSVRIKTWDEMVRLGFNEQPGLIDMESGEPFATPKPVSLKQRSRGSARARSDTGAVDAEQ